MGRGDDQYGCIDEDRSDEIDYGRTIEVQKIMKI